MSAKEKKMIADVKVGDRIEAKYIGVNSSPVVGKVVRNDEKCCIVEMEVPEVLVWESSGNGLPAKPTAVKQHAYIFGDLSPKNRSPGVSIKKL